jgi:enamine deaminase RidA (YjgF/YER057c/UK114 family)
MKLENIDSQSAPTAVGGYTQAMSIEGARRFLLISGQIPESHDGRTPDDFESQCRLVWRNVTAQLEEAGLGVSNLAKVTIFLSSRAFAEINSRVRQEVLGTHRPALTVIITGIYDERWLLEIEAIAAA